jgi:hypothetical protein
MVTGCGLVLEVGLRVGLLLFGGRRVVRLVRLALDLLTNPSRH